MGTSGTKGERQMERKSNNTVVELVEGVGWMLHTDQKEFRCLVCDRSIEVPFKWCKERDEYFCPRCEVGQYCTTIQKEHIHYNIIGVVQNE